MITSFGQPRKETFQAFGEAKIHMRCIPEPREFSVQDLRFFISFKIDSQI